MIKHSLLLTAVIILLASCTSKEITQTTINNLIDTIDARVCWIRENEVAFEKYTSHTGVMFEVWFDDATAVYFNRGFRGLGILELKYYYDSHGRLIFIYVAGIEHDSNGEIVHREFNLYFDDDSLIQLNDVSDIGVELDASKIAEWIANNVDVMIDDAYNEWETLIQEDKDYLHGTSSQ